MDDRNPNTIRNISVGLLLFLSLIPQFSSGQFSDSHTVTVIVQPVTILQINVGTLNMNMTGANAVAGQDQMTMIDQSTTLLWGTNTSNQKICVSTNLAVPQFVMKIEAVNPTAGTSTGEKDLSTMPTDLITSIGKSSGSAGIRFTAIVFASQGTGTDAHFITYTVQTQ